VSKHVVLLGEKVTGAAALAVQVSPLPSAFPMYCLHPSKELQLPFMKSISRALGSGSHAEYFDNV